MERSVSSTVQLSGARVKTFTNFAVDGVSCKSCHMWTTLCYVLSCKSNHVESTDNNYNIKSWCHQIIAGLSTQGCTIGKIMIDSFSLCTHLPMECWQPSDFASDHLDV
eukprot:14861148-Ditylum_brightwellii.AAC.1